MGPRFYCGQPGQINMSQPAPAYSTDSMQSTNVNSSLIGGVVILA
jgi:hypothetical protein